MSKKIEWMPKKSKADNQSGDFPSNKPKGNNKIKINQQKIEMNPNGDDDANDVRSIQDSGEVAIGWAPKKVKLKGEYKDQLPNEDAGLAKDATKNPVQKQDQELGRKLSKKAYTWWNMDEPNKHLEIPTNQ